MRINIHINSLFLLMMVASTLSNPALASPLDLAARVEKTIDLPHAGVEKMVWSDDGTKIAVLLLHGVYVADTRDGKKVMSIWGGGEDNEGRIGSGRPMLAFTPDGEELIAPVYTDGKQEMVWQQGVESNGAYLFTAVNVSSGSSQYIFSPPNVFPGRIRKYSDAASDVACAGSSLITQVGALGYFGVYLVEKLDTPTRYLGPILNKYNNALGVPQLFYDNVRSTLTLVYIDGEIKVWDTAQNKTIIDFSPSITGFSAAALDRSTGNLCTGGNGLITGAGRDNPSTMVQCWNLKNGNLVKAYSGTSSGLNSVTVSPDGRYIAAIEGGERLPLRLAMWSKDKAEPLTVIDYGRASMRSAVAFSPDSSTLAVAVGNRIQLLSVPR